MGRARAAVLKARELGQLPLRALGKTGLQVTTVSLGGVGLGGKEAGDLYGGVSDETVSTGVSDENVSPLTNA